MGEQTPDEDEVIQNDNDGFDSPEMSTQQSIRRSEDENTNGNIESKKYRSITEIYDNTEPIVAGGAATYGSR